jgi:hypothetical protein
VAALRRDLAARSAEMIAEAEETATLMRQLAPAKPHLLPRLAENLSILGRLYGVLGRYRDAVAPDQEPRCSGRWPGHPLTGTPCCGSRPGRPASTLLITRPDGGPGH